MLLAIEGILSWYYTDMEMSYGSAQKAIITSAEDIITVYGALETYLKALAQQSQQDIETIERVARLMIAIKPQAVEASQEIAGREK